MKKGPPDEPAAQVKGGNAQGGLRSETTLAASHCYIAAPHKSQDIFGECQATAIIRGAQKNRAKARL
jgi:hypothetical protein